MSDPIIYVDKSKVRPGKIEQLKVAVDRLVAFLDSNVPRAISYGVYFDESETEMTVIHVHPDSASLEVHMRAGAPEFERFKDLVTLKAIEIYGGPSGELREQLSGKARMLGDGGVAVHTLRSGFSRFASASGPARTRAEDHAHSGGGPGSE